MSQPNAASKPNVYCDGSLNRTVAPPSESNEPARLPQELAHFEVVPNPWHTAVCAALAFCLPNRSTAQLLSLPNDLLLNVATHLHLEPRSLVAFLTCCNALWAPGRMLLFKARVEHQLALIRGNGLEASASSCPMPCYHIEPNLEPEDPVLRHMARGVAIAIGSLMSHVEHQAHGQPYPSVLSERRCARGGPLTAFGTCGPCSAHTTRCRCLCATLLRMDAKRSASPFRCAGFHSAVTGRPCPRLTGRMMHPGFPVSLRCADPPPQLS